MKYCCGPVNRGVAILGGTLYLGTLDAHLVALNARDGRVRWDVEVGKVEDNISITSPPLVAGNKIVTGMAGGDYPSRGFIDAYDAGTGKRLWRFYTVPAEGEPGVETWSGDSWKTGGGATWMNGSYDPALNLVYWGTGNPYPDYDGDVRQDRNLYCNSVVALNADTGKLVWTYQFTPHDVWDYDGVNEMVFADGLAGAGPAGQRAAACRPQRPPVRPRPRHRSLSVRQALRPRHLDHRLRCRRPSRRQSRAPSPAYEGVEVCPGAAGGKEWNAMAYSPSTRLVYLPVIENCALFYNYGAEAKKKGLPPGPNGFRYLPGQAYGKVMAIRADTGEAAWEVKTRTPDGRGHAGHRRRSALHRERRRQLSGLRCPNRHAAVGLPNRLRHSRRAHLVPPGWPPIRGHRFRHGRRRRRLHRRGRSLDAQLPLRRHALHLPPVRTRRIHRLSRRRRNEMNAARKWSGDTYG